MRPLQNTGFCSNSKPEEKLSPQFTDVNEEFDFFDNAEVAFEKMLSKGLKTKNFSKVSDCQNEYKNHQKRRKIE